jgi:hypothetical protein
MTKQEIQELIEQQILCRIAFKGREYPYIAPFQYVTMNGILYFHFTNYGKKMGMLKANSRACVEIESYSPDLSEYKFVALTGKLQLVTDREEKSQAIKALVKEGEKRLSRNFLIAHGLSKSEEWSSLETEKPLVIVKLAEIVETIGLKSS